MKNKLLSGILAGILALTPLITSAEYGIYYGTDNKYAPKTFGLDTMIIQPYNFDLYKTYTGKKICYLSVGEFDGTQEELSNLGLDEAIIGVDTEWNSFSMDMSNLKWQDYLVNEEIKLKNMGCNGLFLDTIWQNGQEEAGISITKKLRENWKDAYIIPNNAHNIKNEIKDYVDGYMFENFWGKTIKNNSGDAKWLLAQMQEYKDLVVGTDKKLFAISYGNPFVKSNKVWGEKVKNLSVQYGFEQIYANSDLTNIYGYLDTKTNTIKKLPGNK